MFEKVRSKVRGAASAVVSAVAGVGAALVAAPAGAAGAPYDPIVAAADISGLSSMQVTILAVAILIPLSFVAFAIVRKSMNKAR